VEDTLVLTVRNHGTAIPPEIIGSLFKPFAREETRSSQNGLGLGLYIASEIAKAHGGALSVTSSEESTDFSFRMALRGA
jgi:sigma-B regulation protein RsbU (phosphoserine phosphatase)